MMNESEQQLISRLWERLRKRIPMQERVRKGGRAPADDQKCFEAIVWMLLHKAHWRELPNCYPHFSAVWRKFRRWSLRPDWFLVWDALLGELRSHEETRVDEHYLASTFALARVRREQTVDG
jgi:transposase